MTRQLIMPELYRGDVDAEMSKHVFASGSVACDIETSGLDWQVSQIGTCQIATEDRVAVIKLDGTQPPEKLRAILSSEHVKKVFHHAPFDLRFMSSQWKAEPRSVACTKIASKVLNPELPNEAHSLQPLLQRHLGVSISKSEQRSDWTSEELSNAQVKYAASDVRYLLSLLDTLVRECAAKGLSTLLGECFHYLPTRVQLDLRGSGDVFSY